MTIDQDISTVQALVAFVTSGRFDQALAKSQTAAADFTIAIDKSIDALQAWKLAIQRSQEAAQLVK